MSAMTKNRNHDEGKSLSKRLRVESILLWVMLLATVMLLVWLANGLP